MNIKQFFIKKNILKKLSKNAILFEQKKIATIGIIFDSTNSNNSKELIQQIESQGIKNQQIKVLLYQDKLPSKTTLPSPYFTLKDLSFSGEIQKKEVLDFLKTPFDLLINYYDVNKYELLGVTLQSKASFKAGFESVDYRVNNIIFTGLASNPKEFISELFKYLKILKAI
jgi:hypothetical protein